MPNQETFLLSPDKQRLERMLKALGNPTRFQIMEILSNKQVCSTYIIVQSFFLAQSTISQHLKVLVNAGLIQSETAGATTHYSIDPEGVRWLKHQVSHWLPERPLPDD